MDDLSPHEQVAAAERDGAALRDGRRLLGLEPVQMAVAAGIGIHELARNEKGSSSEHHAKLRQALEARGVQFGEDGSVSLSALGKEEAATHG